MKFSLLALSFFVAGAQAAKGKKSSSRGSSDDNHAVVQLGPRPYYLVDTMKPSFLKDQLQSCAENMETFQYSDFSIGHRGAALMFPEHTEISWKAAQTMGVGINECDVTFTKDIELVCRHAQCDLHTTTDVVLRPELNAKCTTPWQPNSTTSPKCCTSDFTLAEIKTLCAKMDSSGGNGRATPEQYVFGGTADWRTDLYQYQTTLGNCPRVMKHSESIQIIKSLGGKFTPELKGPEVTMPFNGVYSQEDYAQHMINEYIAAGIPPEDVWPQSFFPADCYYWAANTDYGAQAVALDDQYDRTPAEVEAWMDELIANGVNIVAPPMQKLVDPAPGSPLGMQPSFYARAANEKGLDIITWTLERTPPNLQGFYWESLNAANVPLVAGDKYALLYVLAFQAGILGMFSDWPAPVTFFANCMGLALR